MASCEDLRKVSRYHDGEMPADEARRLGEHIRRCPSCREELAFLRALSRLLSAAAAAEPPEGLRQRLCRKVQPRRDRAILRTARVLTGVAAAVLVVCGALLWLRGADQPAPPGPPYGWESMATATIPARPEQMGAEADLEDSVDVQIARAIVGEAARGGRDDGRDDHE